jgi:hypothetical protein
VGTFSRSPEVAWDMLSVHAYNACMRALVRTYANIKCTRYHQTWQGLFNMGVIDNIVRKYVSKCIYIRASRRRAGASHGNMISMFEMIFLEFILQFSLFN